MDKNIFKKLFDFDADGKLNCFERTAAFGVFINLFEALNKEQEQEEEDYQFSEEQLEEFLCEEEFDIDDLDI